MPNKQQEPRKKNINALPVETRAAEVTTIGWMVTVLTTFAALVAAVILNAVAANTREDGLEALAELVLMASALLGLAVLTLTALVLKMRRTKPPRPITLFAAMVGSAPLVVLVGLRAVAG